MTSARLTSDVREGWTSRRSTRSEWSVTLRRLAAMSDGELGALDLAALSLWAGQCLPGAEALDIGASLRLLTAWSDLVRANTKHWWSEFERSPGTYDHSPGRFRMLALVTVLQRDLGVRYYLPFSQGEYDARDSRNLFLHGILSGHGGTCVTLPVLYIAIGRSLGYPLHLVQAKEHLFARWDEPGGERFNIECTSLGFRAPDDDHYRHSPKPLTAQDLASGQFRRSLAPREVLALLLKERGQCLMDHLRLDESLEAFSYSNQLAPSLPGLQYAWATATVLHRAIESAKRRTRVAGHNRLDVSNLPLPSGPDDFGNAVNRNARDHLQRIVKIHSRKTVSAHSHLFEQLGAGGNPFSEGVTSCTTPPWDVG